MVARFEPVAAYIGLGEYVGDTEEAPDGEYVLHSDYESACARMLDFLDRYVTSGAVTRAEANDLRGFLRGSSSSTESKS